jgi:hypothetical protein
MQRFKNRWVVVTEKRGTWTETQFRYRSYARERDASAAVSRVYKLDPDCWFRRAYVVDRENMKNIILP